ncbi:MAG TPA: lysozyme inhibitor LprI family protein [Blastocatellia bacterium]|nr:lysozyme inhibitor LprI family protein [Blastocatellia bacterium]
MIRFSRYFLGSIIITLLACAMPRAQAEADLNPDACAKYKKADAELNRVYQRVLSEYTKDAVFIQKLRAAQRAWIVYRDAQVESRYPALNKLSSYGNVYPVCRCLELIRLTNSRTTELQRWLDGVVEGDVCAGSIKINN